MVTLKMNLSGAMRVKKFEDCRREKVMLCVRVERNVPRGTLRHGMLMTGHRGLLEKEILAQIAR